MDRYADLRCDLGTEPEFHDSVDIVGVRRLPVTVRALRLRPPRPALGRERQLRLLPDNELIEELCPQQDSEGPGAQLVAGTDERYVAAVVEDPGAGGR